MLERSCNFTVELYQDCHCAEEFAEECYDKPIKIENCVVSSWTYKLSYRHHVEGYLKFETKTLDIVEYGWTPRHLWRMLHGRKR